MQDVLDGRLEEESVEAMRLEKEAVDQGQQPSEAASQPPAEGLGESATCMLLWAGGGGGDGLSFPCCVVDTPVPTPPLQWCPLSSSHPVALLCVCVFPCFSLLSPPLSPYFFQGLLGPPVPALDPRMQW
jgi:hypothetical protein